MENDAIKIQEHLRDRFPQMSDADIQESSRNLIALADFLLSIQPTIQKDGYLTDSENSNTMKRDKQ